MNTKISAYQLFSITFLFQFGTTIIFAFEATVGRDAWMVTLLSFIIGIMLVAMYLGIMQLNPGLTLVEWFPRQFGKWIGIPIALLYPCVFLLDAARIIGDLRDLVPTTILPNTPPLVLIIVFGALALYGLTLGIENISRLGQILLPILVGLFFLELIFLLFSDIVNWELLKPFLWKGWVPVIKTTILQGITQTYGESIALAMIWVMVDKKSKVWKATLISTAFVFFLILLLDIFSITVFGDVLFQRLVYPFYSLSGMVNIQGFITNLNPFAVVTMISTAYFKLVIKMYAALTGIQILLRLKKGRRLILPAVLLIIILGMTLDNNVTEHISIISFQVVTPYVWIPIYIGLPLLLFVVSLIRHKLKSAR